MVPIGAEVFKCLKYSVMGPCLENQKKIFTYIYNRYNGVLKRFCLDVDSTFYILKENLVDFILAMSDGMNEDIIRYQSINFELETLKNVMIFSLCQLYNEKIKGFSLRKKKNEGNIIQLNITGIPLSEYKIEIKDFSGMLNAFKNNDSFIKHPLFQISLKIFHYLNIFSEKRSVFKYFCLKREEMSLSQYEKIILENPNQLISVQDFVCFKFLEQIYGECKNNLQIIKESKPEKKVNKDIVSQLKELSQSPNFSNQLTKLFDSSAILIEDLQKQLAEKNKEKEKS